MLILGIESSCDETAAAVIADGETIVSNIVAAQHDLHRPFGGVIPELAARAHAERITAIVSEALVEAECTFSDLSAIAVTNRPGLVGSLLIGLTAAKSLAWANQLPLVCVDHLFGHIYSTHLAGHRHYPHVALLVSGGHTALYHVESPLGIETLGQTIDDAAGEAFDKGAKLLDLGFPGGPALSKWAAKGDPKAFDFPRTAPKAKGKSKSGKNVREDRKYDFSFSGLKTALFYHLRGTSKGRGPLREIDDTERADVAASYQEALCEVLVDRTLGAAEAEKVSHVAVSGGVACNGRLREIFQEKGKGKGIETFFPPPALCGDNAAMIAGLGFHYFKNGEIGSLDVDVDPTPRRAPRRVKPAV